MVARLSGRAGRNNEARLPEGRQSRYHQEIAALRSQNAKLSNNNALNTH